MADIKNAIIKSTMLGYEAHGILTCNLTMDFGSFHQGFGGYSIGGKPSEETQRKYPEGYAVHCIKGILETVGVEHWEELKGRHVRVEHNGGRIIAIGNFLEDKWFSFE